MSIADWEKFVHGRRLLEIKLNSQAGWRIIDLAKVDQSIRLLPFLAVEIVDEPVANGRLAYRHVDKSVVMKQCTERVVNIGSECNNLRAKGSLTSDDQ